MRTVTIYTDGKAGFAALIDVPTRSPLARQPLGDDKHAPLGQADSKAEEQRGTYIQ